jgi:putative transposase
MTLLQKTYCCRIDGANERKLKELSSLSSSIQKVSHSIFDLRFFLDEKDFYHAVRELHPSVNSKQVQKVTEQYRDLKDVFSLKRPIDCSLLFDNQMFDIQLELEEKYFNAFVRVPSTKKNKRMNVPLSGLWPIKKLKEAKKIDQVEIKKHQNGSFYAHITASFECAPLIKSGKGIGIDLNHKGIVLSNNKFYSLKELIHHKDEARKNKSAKKNEQTFTNDFIHKVTTSIVRDLRDIEVLFLEDLSGLRNKSSKKKGTSKGKKLNARSNNFPFSMIQSQLAYKANEIGIRVIKDKKQTINTSKQCSKCGSLKTERTKQNSFRCLSCGFSLHADLNGARNIERKGKALLNAETNDTPLHAPENKNAEIPHCGINHGSIEEASVSGGIAGYQLPLGMGTKEKDRLTNPYKSSDKNKKIDSDEKIRNELATTDKVNYIKKHPINKQQDILKK